MAINFVVPEVSLPPFFFRTLAIFLFIRNSFLLNTPFSFCPFFYPQKLLGFG